MSGHRYGVPAELEGHMTLRELAKFLGRDWKTLERWLKKGKLPQPVAVTDHGWRMWSPEQVTEILAKVSRKPSA